MALLAHSKPSKLSVLLGCRDEIASCSERAYSSLTIAEAKKLMLFSSDAEALKYADQVSMHAHSPAPASFREILPSAGLKGCARLPITFALRAELPAWAWICTWDKLRGRTCLQILGAPNCSVAHLHTSLSPGVCREAGACRAAR